MKLTLREIFLLLLVFGLSLGWWLDRRRLAAENDRMLASLQIFLLLDPAERPTIEQILQAGEEARRRK